MTSNTIASFTSLIESETVAVEFQALSFFAITKYFFILRYLFNCRVGGDISMFWRRFFTFLWLFMRVKLIILLLIFWMFHSSPIIYFIFIFQLMRIFSVTFSFWIYWWTFQLTWIFTSIFFVKLEDNARLYGKVLSGLTLIDLSVLLGERSLNDDKFTWKKVWAWLMFLFDFRREG